MANNLKKITSIQSDLFQQLEMAPEQQFQSTDCDLDIQLQLRSALDTALKLARKKGISRERVVDEMNRVLPDLVSGKKITLRKINAWMALSKEDSEFPARFIPAFCVATQCDMPLRILANSINYDLADQRELLAQELGKAEIERAVNIRRIKTIKSKLGE